MTFWSEKHLLSSGAEKISNGSGFHRANYGSGGYFNKNRKYRTVSDSKKGSGAENGSHGSAIHGAQEDVG